MRTSLMLPDDLYREVKRTAAASDRTVTAFVEEALRAALARENASRPVDRRPYRVTPLGAGGLQRGIDLSDSSTLLDAMEDR